MMAAGIGALGSVGNGLLGYFGSKDASNAQAQAAQNALMFQQMVYGNNQKNIAPFLGMGSNAANTLTNLYSGAGGQDFSAFKNSPDYQFAFDQGQDATTKLLSARGGLMSGGGLTALTNYGQGMASQQFQNYVGRLMQMATLGSQSATGAASAANTSGAQIGNTWGNLGTAQASGIMGGFNALGGAFNGLGNNAWMYALGNKNAGSNPSSYAQASPQINTGTTDGTSWG